jgi:hypothetical protein
MAVKPPIYPHEVLKENQLKLKKDFIYKWLERLKDA